MALLPSLESAHVLIDNITFISNKLYHSTPFWSGKENINFSSILSSFGNIFGVCGQSPINDMLESQFPKLIPDCLT